MSCSWALNAHQEQPAVALRALRRERTRRRWRVVMRGRSTGETIAGAPRQSRRGEHHGPRAWS